MTDGPTDATDLDKTEANKALVRGFVEKVLIGGQTADMPGYFDGDAYTQHNPGVGDGVSSLGAAMQQMAAAGKTMKLDRVHKVLGEGSFVLTMSEGAIGGTPTAFYDLFRVKNGKIAEHWDTIETIPPREEWKNSNGKF